MSGFSSFLGGLATGLDALLNRPGSYPSANPSKSILSSNVTLNFVGSDGSIIPIAEFDEMNKTKALEEKKRFKPFGSTKTISLLKDNGWDITLTGQKTDGLLDRVIYIQEKLLNGTGMSSVPNIINTFGINEAIATRPLFEIMELVRDNNKQYHTYTYRDVSIIGYSENNPGDMNPITYNLTLFSPGRDFTIAGNDDVGDDAEANISDIITDMIDRNKD